jgi:hypothetical protein
MARGQPTTRTRAWQSKQNNIFPFFLQAALAIAQAENSKTITFIETAFAWAMDCYEWTLEAQKADAAFQQQVLAEQKS